MQVFGHSLCVLKQLQPPLSSQRSGKVSNYINEVKIQDPSSIQCVKIQGVFNVFFHQAGVLLKPKLCLWNI